MSKKVLRSLLCTSLVLLFAFKAFASGPGPGCIRNDYNVVIKVVHYYTLCTPAPGCVCSTLVQEWVLDPGEVACGIIMSSYQGCFSGSEPNLSGFTIYRYSAATKSEWHPNDEPENVGEFSDMTEGYQSDDDIMLINWGDCPICGWTVGP